jgi:hypothetical protein
MLLLKLQQQLLECLVCACLCRAVPQELPFGKVFTDHMLLVRARQHFAHLLPACLHAVDAAAALLECSFGTTPAVLSCSRLKQQPSTSCSACVSAAVTTVHCCYWVATVQLCNLFPATITSKWPHFPAAAAGTAAG